MSGNPKLSAVIICLLLLLSGCDNNSIANLKASIQGEVAAAALQQSSEIAVFIDEKEVQSGELWTDFANIPPGQNHSVVLKVKNLGGINLTVDQPQISPIEGSPFAVASLPADRVLGQGESLEFTVKLDAPLSSGDHKASLYIFSNDDDEDSFRIDMNWSAFDVIYKFDNDDADNKIAALPNSKLLEPFPPQKLGYLFTGWYKDSNFNSPWYFETDTVSADTQLYARWSYHSGVPVYYNANGADGEPPASQWKVTNETLVLALGQGSLEKNGYYFNGWNTNEAGTGRDFAPGDEYAVEQELTLYAQWSPKTYTVTFNTAPGSTVAPQNLLYNSRVTLPAAPTLQDWSFAGWYIDSSFNYPWDFTLDTVQDDTVIYAKWSNETFTVTFNTNGGSVIPPETVIYGDSLGDSVSSSKSGCAFKGWFSDTDLTEEWDLSDPVTIDMTLHAKWEEIIAGNKITYDGGNGYSFDTVQVPGAEMFPFGKFDTEIAVISQPYEISTHEVSYKLWYKVAVWADNNAGYESFYKDGMIGDGDDTLEHPVGGVSNLTQLIFCNALTEWVNSVTGSEMKCCYYYYDQKDQVLRSKNGEDNYYWNSSADGFRILERQEWELAARWSTDDDNATVSWAADPWFTAWNTYSGSPVIKGSDDDPDSGISRQYVWDTANSGGTVHISGTKLPNDLGIYDMSGNMPEIAWRSPTGTFYRYYLGGYINTVHDDCTISFYYESKTGSAGGIRPARSIF